MEMDVAEESQNFDTCRLCAKVKTIDNECAFISLFQPIEGIQSELNNMREQLKAWQLKIAPEDGLPQRACVDCFLVFCSIDEFKKKCHEAQVILQNGNVNTANGLPFLEQLPDALFETTEQMGMQQEQPVLAGATDAMLQQQIINNNNVEANVAVNLNDLKVAATTTTNFNANILVNAEQYNNNNSNGQFDDTAQMQLPANMAVAEAAPMQQQPFYETVFAAANNVALPQQTTTTAAEVTAAITTTTAAAMYAEAAGDVETLLTGSLIMKKQKDADSINDKKQQSEQQLAAANATSAHALKQKQQTNITKITNNDNDYDDEQDVPNSRVSGNPYACQYCYCSETGAVDHLIFANEDALTQHLFDAHDPNLPYTCPHCPCIYQTAHLRDKHIQVQHNQMRRDDQKCHHCGKIYRTSTEQHENTTCQFTRDWYCNQCDAVLVKTPLHRFRAHERMHEVTTTMYSCHVCNRAFVRKANMVTHMRSHNSKVQKEQRCDQCNAIFFTIYDLKKHKYSMHQGELPCKCIYCNKGFVSNSFLSRHIKNTHAGDGRFADTAFKCDNCAAIFPTEQKLQWHEQLPRDENGQCVAQTNDMPQRHRVQRQGKFLCKLCNQCFHSRIHLEKHLKTHDERLRPFYCQQCNMRFRSKFEMKEHLNNDHVQLFQCPKCGKCFDMKRKLNEHLLSHAEVNIKCNEPNCNYVGKNRKVLAAHARSEHAVHSCQYCGKFFTRQGLISHLRSAHRNEINLSHSETEAAVRSLTLLNQTKSMDNNQSVTVDYFDILNGDLLETEQEIVVT